LQSFMKKLVPFLFVLLLTDFLTVANTLADGGFVVSQFVWNKHKDISEPTQKAIIVYDAGREDLILQVKYEGPVDEFGWLIPVPTLPTVRAGSIKCFYELSQLTQQRFETGFQMMSANLSGEKSEVTTEPPVKVIETKTVGAYEIAVLSAKDSDALAKWMDANQFYFPASKADVLDAYVKRQWYFVAVRINLSRSGGFRLLNAPRQAQNKPTAKYATHLKLASGELNPLQISFASDHCVFPLKISSINGQQSEVQVYILSPEPLLESKMLKKELPLIYSNDVARAVRRAQSMRNLRLINMAFQIHSAGGTPHGPSSLPSLSPEDEEMLRQARQTPGANPDELLPFVRVTTTDLPETTKWISRLANKTWWLTKQTWTFQPEEMHDLQFDPALQVFAEMLGSKYGYFAAANLTPFGADAVPVIIAAMQSTNPTVRINAAGNFTGAYWGYSSTGYQAIRDSRLTEAAVTWLKDSEPAVRFAGVQMLTDYSTWNPKDAESLVAMLRDKDARVRHAVAFALPQFSNDMEKYIPSFQQMLKDTNPGVQWSGLEMLQRLQVEIPRKDLLLFFKSSDPETLGVAFSQLSRQGEKISDNEALPLLQNLQPVARLLGLRVLDQNPDKHSVELALPLLQDSDELVRLKATQTLQALTGQEFGEDQTDEWVKWWTENKTNFVPLSSPSEESAPHPSTPEEDEVREAAFQWQHTDKRQARVEELLATSITNPPDVMFQGGSLAKILHNSASTGTKKLSLNQMLALKPVITGDDPATVTFEFPIAYDVATNLGDLCLMIDPDYNTDDEEGSGAEQVDSLRATNGNFQLVWHTIYESPGKHALQAAFFLKSPNEDKPDASGSFLPFVVSNLCQFSVGSATYDVQHGAVFHARLQETNGFYSIECVSTNGEHLKTITGRTTNGEFKVVWNLVDDNNRRLTGETFSSIVHITLPDSGRSQTLKGP
jgi:hypothetical protein